MLHNCQGSKGHLHPNHQRSQDHPWPAPSGRLKLLALWPSGMLRPGGPLRPSHSTGNMAKPSETWRNKSSKRKAEACQAALHASPAELKGMLVASYHILVGVGTDVPPIHPYHKGTPQQSNSPPQQILLCQCPSSPLGPKGGILPQTLWIACLWVGVHPKQPWKSPTAPNGERSHLGTRCSSRAAQKHSAGTLTW